ncbi:MAG: hypothetical protein RSE23_01810 [Clostridia bacterium]
MATFSVEGFDEVLLELEKEKDGFLERAQQAVQAGGLKAAQLLQTAAPKHSKHLSRSFKMTPPEHNLMDGIYVDVYPSGTQPNGRKKASNEEVGFIQEYGSSSNPANPWMRPTIENHADEINAAMAAVFSK